MELASLSRGVSPPPLRKRLNGYTDESTHKDRPVESATNRPLTDSNERRGPRLADVEAGQADITDHLDYFTKHFQAVLRPGYHPRLDLEDFEALYKRNQHNHGHHFVVHQHDHPISGVHYDLRLQFSDSSTISFAIPYGVPGNSNSVRPNRMAVETRVHSLWNNLIESASHASGSLLIWDTGEYEVLPWKETRKRLTDDELSDRGMKDTFTSESQSERLRASFKRRRIRLRLHGTRLPPNYTISMWLTSDNDRDRQPKEPKRKRRRRDPAVTAKSDVATSSDNESADDTEQQPPLPETNDDNTAAGLACEDEDEAATIRANNAYPGATNDIGSVHQRNWFLTLDKRNSGFRKARSGPDDGRWIGGFEPFFVRGRDRERSIVTGRSADEVMEDGGMDKFVGRKMWRAILE